VCGKGIDAAALTGLARHTVAAAAFREETPSAVLGVLNDVILREGTERFCTVAYGRLDPPTNGERRWTLTASSGGHPLPLVLRTSGDVETVACQGTLLGVVPAPQLTDCTVELGPGDAVLFYTDGVIEARGGDTVFGPERLLKLWRDCKGLEAQDCSQMIEQAVIDFEGDSPRDDVALLVVRVMP
jgi:phosphoserine phosphatase RsbU/P